MHVSKTTVTQSNQDRSRHGLRLVLGLLLVITAGCDFSEYKPQDQVYSGEAAKEHLWPCDKATLPQGITDLWVFDGGSFGDSIYYTSFRCRSIEDCWQAVGAFGGPDASEFSAGIQTRFAVNQHGPRFYWKELAHPEWDLNAVTDAVSYETANGRDNMEFWAIDLKALRVYYHRESGGFPDDPPTVRHR